MQSAAISEVREAEFEKRLDRFKYALSFEGHVVFDNSALNRLGFLDYRYIPSSKEDELKLDLFRKEISILKILHEYHENNEALAMATDEVREEYEYFNEKILKENLKKTKKLTRRRMRGRDWDYTISVSDFKLVNESKFLLSRLIKSRRRFIFNFGSLEEAIPAESSFYLEDISDTIQDLSYDFLNRNPAVAEKKLSCKVIEHEAHDEYIMAKCFAASYDAPVTVVTADLDFRDLWFEIYKNMPLFRKKGIPSLPIFNIRLLLFDRNAQFREYFPAGASRDSRRESEKRVVRVG